MSVTPNAPVINSISEISVVFSNVLAGRLTLAESSRSNPFCKVGIKNDAAAGRLSACGSSGAVVSARGRRSAVSGDDIIRPSLSNCSSTPKFQPSYRFTA